MPGPEDLLSQAERRRILLDGTTMHQHAVSQADELAQGRFRSQGVPTVTGATPAQQIPQLPSSSPWSGASPGPGLEEPLGYDINALEPSVPPSAEGIGGPVSAAPSTEPLPPADVERDAGPSSPEDRSDG